MFSPHELVSAPERTWVMSDQDGHPIPAVRLTTVDGVTITTIPEVVEAFLGGQDSPAEIAEGVRLEREHWLTMLREQLSESLPVVLTVLLVLTAALIIFAILF